MIDSPMSVEKSFPAIRMTRFLGQHAPHSPLRFFSSGRRHSKSRLLSSPEGWSSQLSPAPFEELDHVVVAVL